MTSANDRWAEKAGRIFAQFNFEHNCVIECSEQELLERLITQALHSAEKEGVRIGMEKAANICEDNCEAYSDGGSKWFLMKKEGPSYNGLAYAKAIREEANKEL